MLFIAPASATAPTAVATKRKVASVPTRLECEASATGNCKNALSATLDALENDITYVPVKPAVITRGAGLVSAIDGNCQAGFKVLMYEKESDVKYGRWKHQFLVTQNFDVKTCEIKSHIETINPRED